ncbi:thiamine pyrophosphate-binding protein [Streptomyces sp. INA 01156]
MRSGPCCPRRRTSWPWPHDHGRGRDSPQAGGARRFPGLRIPGETSLSLYAAFQRNDELTHVVGRCPRGAAYAAEAYARISGGVAVCDAPEESVLPTPPRPSWRRTTAARRWC